MRAQILTYGEAAEQLGTTYPVVAGLVIAHGITPKRVKHNGKAKGLDRSDMMILRRALGLKLGEKVRRDRGSAVATAN